jgi:hypothetical protein
MHREGSCDAVSNLADESGLPCDCRRKAARNKATLISRLIPRQLRELDPLAGCTRLLADL